MALVDLNREGLEETAKAMQAHGTRTTRHVVDVADRGQIHALAADVLEYYGKADIIVNNAGVVQFERIAEASYEDLEWLWRINFWGVVYGTKAFLPHFLDRGEGHIVNISSLGGFLTTPLMGAYCASKFAVRGFTETLYQEVRRLGVGVTCVHPSGVSTDLARNARIGRSAGFTTDELVPQAERMSLTRPEKAAARIVRAIKKNHPRVIIGADARIACLLQRLSPLLVLRAAELITRPLSGPDSPSRRGHNAAGGKQ